VALKEAWATRHMAIVLRDPGELSHVSRALIDHLQSAATAQDVLQEAASR
jgi:hypothetical protein